MLAKEGNQSAAIAGKLKDDSERFLATVQIGVTVVGTLASAIGGVAAIEVLKPIIQTIPLWPFQRYGELISITIVATAIIYATLVFGELVPKSLGIRYAERLACLAAMPIDYLSRVSSFLVKLLTKSSNLVMRPFGVKGIQEGVFISEEEIKYFIREGKTKGIFEETEEALIHGVFEFADTTVKEVMVPKHKFNAIDIDTPPEKTLDFIVESGFSRYPVFKETLDNIVGILYHKDIFKIIEENRPLLLREIMRSPYFIPDTAMISRLLREMQRKRVHMAIVVNEHGEVEGLVTIEDLLEEIVGEIEDEYDIEKGGLIERLKDGTMIIDASASMRDLKDVGLSFEESEEYTTLAGYMLSRLQKIPRGGEYVLHNGYKFTIVDVEGRRIVKVKAERLTKGLTL